MKIHGIVLYVRTDRYNFKFQLAWQTNLTACWRPAPDFNMTYLSVARLDSRPRTAEDVGATYSQLSSCCGGNGNIYLARTDCGGVACFTNDQSLVEQWNNCAGSKLSNFSAFASKIDYNVYKQKSETWEKKNSAASSAMKIWLMLGCVAGSILTSALA